MTIENTITTTQYTGYLHRFIKPEEVNGATKEARVQEILKRQIETIQPIYETKGKLVDIVI